MPDHYSTLSGVSLTTDVASKVKKIADKYYELTQKDIVITSGTRTAQSQAEAMYGKLSGGDRLTVYAQKKAAGEVRDAYDAAVKAKKSKSDTIDDIKKVIEAQIKRGVYISKHLKKGAVDVRSRDMTTQDKAHFRTAAGTVSAMVILETVPPHFHLQF